MKYLIISAFLPPILCQLGDMVMKPDVTFGDHNDRFDLTSLYKHQNRYYDRPHYEDEDDNYRRSGDFKILRFSDLRNTDTPSVYDGDLAEFNENLKKLLATNSRRAHNLVNRLHEDGKFWRRSNSEMKESELSVTELPPDPEKEVLMHYAVPVELTIKGYIQAPLID